jgi:BirA family biotin operon repressor/biotin-[acetyl-CoA-carboxylase] ligase
MPAHFTGKNFILLDRVSSTNSYVQELLSKSTPLEEGSVIMAVEQSAGRGQMGNFWEAETGKNLTFSILYKPDSLAIEDQFYLSMAISLGICDFLEKQLSHEFTIKWPNDIYYNHHKIAGILIENTLQGDKIKNSVIGIGLNVNQLHFESEAPNPISMKHISNKDYVLEELLFNLLNFIEYYYLALKSNKTEYLKERYLSKLLFYGQYHSYKTINGIIDAKIIDIGPYGKLCLESASGINYYDIKELEFIL